MITGENFIGKKRSAKGQKIYKTFNPKLNTKNTWKFYEADIDELNEAVALATNAFREYSNFSGKQKAEFLNAIADEIMALGDELIEVYCTETGLPEGRAKGERGRTVNQLKSFADYISEGSWVEATIDKGDAEREPAPKPDIRKMLFPIGPVAVFGASNFPLAFSTVGGDTASALAAGCSVIVKSHPMHSGTAELMASAVIKAAEKTNMPNGIFSLLNSSDKAVGEALVLHPGIKAVGFTGSLKGGRALHDLGSLRPEPIPVFAEMGSINPTVLLPKALQNKNLELAKSYASSITMGTGQFCTNPGLLIGIKSDGFSNFIDHLADEISKIEPSCMLNPNIAETFQTNKMKAFNNSEVEIISNYDTEVNDNFAQQAIVKVKGSDFLKNESLQEEVFGPFSMVVECEDLPELESVVLKLQGQLTGTIISDENEIKDYPNLVEKLITKVGRLIFNGVPTGVEVVPAMLHGGPYPASTDSRFTAVGNDAIKRWVRPVSYQDWPNELLPDELKNENPLGINRRVDGNTVVGSK